MSTSAVTAWLSCGPTARGRNEPHRRARRRRRARSCHDAPASEPWSTRRGPRIRAGASTDSGRDFRDRGGGREAGDPPLEVERILRSCLITEFATIRIADRPWLQRRRNRNGDPVDRAAPNRYLVPSGHEIGKGGFPSPLLTALNLLSSLTHGLPHKWTGRFTGWSPIIPHWVTVTPLSEVFLIHQVPSPGLHTATSVVPSPS